MCSSDLFSSEELRLVLGLDRAAITERLGDDAATVIHRDQFVLTPRASARQQAEPNTAPA